MRKRFTAARRHARGGPGILCEELADSLSPLLRNRCTDMFFIDPRLHNGGEASSDCPVAGAEPGYDYRNSPILTELYMASLRCTSSSSAGAGEAALRRVRTLKTPAMRADEIARACDGIQKAVPRHGSCARCRGIQQAIAAMWVDIRDGALEPDDGDIRFARFAAGRRNPVVTAASDAGDPAPYFIGIVLFTPLAPDGGLPHSDAGPEQPASTRLLLSQRPLLSMALTRLELSESPPGLPGSHTMRLAYVIGPIPSAEACVRIVNNVIVPMQGDVLKRISRAHEAYGRQQNAAAASLQHQSASCIRTIRREAGDDAVFIYSDAELRGEDGDAVAAQAYPVRAGTGRLLVPSVN